MPGVNASNFHIGSRSEMLADYFFGTFGPVTPVRGHDDFGLDLYCALAERVGQRFFAREYFSVQVKSTTGPWIFETPEEIRWLIEQPNPIFLCVVEKKRGLVEVFHTFGRFAVPPNQLLSRLVLTPGSGDRGEFCSRNDSGEIDLGAPIIRADITEFYDETKQAQLRSVLEGWLRYERTNLDYRRMGLTLYQMPPEYRTNEPTTAAIQWSGWYPSNAEDVRSGIDKLAAAIACVGDQLRYLRDMRGAVRAAVLLDYLQAAYPRNAWDSFVTRRGGGHLVPDVAARLRIQPELEPSSALEALQREIDGLPRVVAAIDSARETIDPFAFAPPEGSSSP